MEAEPPPKNHHDHPSTSGSLGYFQIRLLGPAAPLLLRSGRLYFLSSRRRGPCLRLLASPTRRRRDLLLSTSGCVLRLTHHFSSANAVRVNGRPVHAGPPAELDVGDEVSLLRRGARYGFVVEKFVPCEVGETAAGSCEEVLVLRAESLRKRLRAISESHDPLSFLRDSHCLENGSADVGLKKAREEDDLLCLDNPISPVPEENLPREDCNLDQDNLEHHSDVAKADIVELIQGSKGCSNDNADQKGCSNGSVEQHHSEGCYSDGSTFFLNRLAGIGPDVRVEPHSGVALPQLLHSVDSLVRVFISTFTSDIPWFLDYCKIPQHLPVTIAVTTRRDAGVRAAKVEWQLLFESYPNLLLVYPQFPEVIAFGKDRKKQGVACHHPKLIVLQREDNMRVIVTSANLVPRQWHLITNTVWWQNFPCRTSPDYSALFSAVEETKSDFAAQLVSFIGYLINEVPSQAYWINEIAKYDFEGAGGYLVASVPGLYVQTAKSFLFGVQLLPFNSDFSEEFLEPSAEASQAFNGGHSHRKTSERRGTAARHHKPHRPHPQETRQPTRPRLVPTRRRRHPSPPPSPTRGRVEAEGAHAGTPPPARTPRAIPMSPSPLLVRPPAPAPANPSLQPRRCAPVLAAAATPSAAAVAPFSRLRTKCRFAASDVREDYSSTPIDVVADVKTEKLVVLGGSGFVGSAICRAAVSKGIEVVSLSRSGRPSYSDPWVDQVTWLAGDVFYARWDEVFVGATAVVSTLGGFGNEEQMKRINGEANVIAVDAAKEFGAPKFILISVHDYNLPSFLLNSGYFTGKRKAESEVLSKYPTSGVVLRPGFIYGKRKVDGFEIPLDVVGQPLEKLLSSVENFTKPLSSLPASDLILAPPVSVDDVAYAVINAVVDDSFFGVFTIEQIKEAAAKVRV